MRHAKNFIAAFSVAAAGLLTGCTSYFQIAGPDFRDSDMPDVKSSYSQVFNGAADQVVSRVSGSDLQEGHKYSLKGGLLIIDGDVPANTRISVTNGKLYINGDVGEHTVINAYVPEKHYDEPSISVRSRGTDGLSRDLNDMSQGHLSPSRAYRTPLLGSHSSYVFKYPNDRDPAVVITGNVSEKAVIRSNHGIHVSGTVDSSAKLKTWYDTDITSGKVPNLYITPSVTPAP